MTIAIRELDVGELDSVAGGISMGSLVKVIVVGAAAAICKGAAEAFVGGLASGLETGGAGFVVAAAGGAAAAGCAYWGFSGGR
jgi:hypothetical protein